MTKHQQYDTRYTDFDRKLAIFHLGKLPAAHQKETKVARKLVDRDVLVPYGYFRWAMFSQVPQRWHFWRQQHKLNYRKTCGT